MSARRFGTSCKPCRKSRIGCDAILQNGRSCTNCVRRRKLCDNPTKDTDASLYDDSNSEPTAVHPGFSEQTTIRPSFCSNSGSFESPLPVNSPPLQSFDLEYVAQRRMQARGLHELLWENFFIVFESRSPHWFGDSCSPYIGTKLDTKPLVSRTVIELDRLEAESLHGEKQKPSTSFERGSHLDTALNDALRYAVYAYSACWLPLQSAFQEMRHVDETTAAKMAQQVRNSLWRRARSSILAAMSRPSYRSVLALLLFAYTEMPVDTEDNGFNHLCNEVLFSHVKYLRSPFQRRSVQPLSEYTTAVPLVRDALDPSSLKRKEKGSEREEHMRDSIFWLGVICDSARALLNQSSPIILPGKAGDDTVWPLIRQRTVIFDHSFRRLQASPLPLPPEITVVVLQHASACKTMYLGMLNQFCDAVYNNSTTIGDAAQDVLMECRRFHDVFDHLLDLCARNYLTLTSETQLNYVLLLLHYHLGSLVLADTLDTLDMVPEPLKNPILSREYACNAIVNTLTLALNHDRYSSDESHHGSMFLRDPTPIFMVEILSRTGKAIFRLNENGKLGRHTTQSMISVVITALNVLSQISVTASYVLKSFQDTCSQKSLAPRGSNHYTTSSAKSEHMSLLGMCDSDFIEEFLQEMQIQSASDSKLLDRTIADCEQAKLASLESPGRRRDSGGVDEFLDNFSTNFLQSSSAPNFVVDEHPNIYESPGIAGFEPALSTSDG